MLTVAYQIKAISTHPFKKKDPKDVFLNLPVICLFDNVQ